MSNDNQLESKGFIFGDTKKDGVLLKPKQILHVAEMDTYLVHYTDGENKEQTRICFRIKNSDTTFILNEGINGKDLATTTRKWFHEALSAKLAPVPVDEEEVVGSV